MPAAGVYGKEIDLSLYIEVASEFVVGVVGAFSKGPINEKTLVTNLPALEGSFGKPIDDDALCQPFFGLREYLRAGNQAWVVRTQSSTSPAKFSSASLRGGTEDNLATNSDGASSIPATRTLTSAGAAFIAAGILAGDVVEVHDTSSPADNGFYVVSIVAATVLTVNRDWPTGSLTNLEYTVWTAKRQAGTDGVTSAETGRTFTSASAKFQANGVAAGDILYVHDSSADDGFFVVESVTNETTLVVNHNWPAGSLTALTYTIYGRVHPTANDGSTAVAGRLSSASSKFQSHGVQEGDILYIHDSVDLGNNGYYVISGLHTGAEETTVDVVNATWGGGSLTNLTFDIYPGVVLLQGISEGAWIDGYTAKAVPNTGSNLQFDLEIRDAGGFLLETVYSLDTTNVVTELANNSSYVTGEALTNRVGPAMTESSSFDGGDNGTTGLADADFLGSSLLGTGLQAFRNPEEVALDAIAVPGYSSSIIGDALINMAEYTRGDCMAIVDPPDYPTVNSVQDVIDWHNGTGGFGRTTALNSSHGALYWPWCKIDDTYNSTTRWTSPSGHAMGVWAQSDNIAKPWFAPAGTTRGKVAGATDVRMSPDNGQRSAMQTSNNVNPIVKFIKEGITIFGQKTLLRTTSALNRIAVRRMLLYVERAVLGGVKALTFEPSDATTDREFVRLTTPVCQFVKDNRGMTEFLILANDTTSPPSVREQNKMIAKIYIKPTPTAEVIEVQFILTPQNANFQELLAA